MAVGLQYNYFIILKNISIPKQNINLEKKMQHSKTYKEKMMITLKVCNITMFGIHLNSKHHNNLEEVICF